MTALTPEQARAVERRDASLLVRAGAGTGKTTVLVERYVRAVVDDGAAVESMLAITFTEKAAAEMRTRVRRRFLELGRRDDARAAEGAWISTIHGLCSRILRSHALSAGIDPDFRVLDQIEADRLALEAFDGALEAFMAEGADPERIEMVAARTPDKLRDMVRTAYSHLRSRGQRRPALEPTVAPLPAGERERLDAAARAALDDLGGAATSSTVVGAIERLETALDLLDKLEDGQFPEATELKALELKGRAKALSTEACEDYREAYAEFRSFVLTRQEQRDHTMLSGLIELYGERYERAKRERSGLDFEDLELVSRDLLANDAGLREAYAHRFAHVLVDEFQDTNPLQNELLQLLSRDNLFRVGDENQSIYRFRNADVGVFRSHWDEAVETGRAESITVNFRARGEILDAIDLAFTRTWGERFEPLREAPGSREPASRVDPCVELLVVDRPKGRWEAALDLGAGPFGAALQTAPPWRAAEARLLAKRVDELTGEGPYSFGDVVMLFRATTAMGFFERALEERGIPVHVVGGRGYFAQQQVVGPAPLAVRARQPAGRARGLLAARLPARRPVARRCRADRPARPSLGPRPLVGGERAGGRAAHRAAGARPAPPRGVRRALRGRAARGRPGGSRDADRPRRHGLRLRQPPARAAGWHPPHGQRAQADADGARVRGRRGPRPARLRRRARRARRARGPRGRGTARGRGARRRADDDHPPRQGPRVPGGVRVRPRQGRPRRRGLAADLGGRQRRAPARRPRRIGRQRAARAPQGAGQGRLPRRRSGGSSTWRPRARSSICC